MTAPGRRLFFVGAALAAAAAVLSSRRAPIGCDSANCTGADRFFITAQTAFLWLALALLLCGVIAAIAARRR
jgi:hypothetical protein